MNDQSLPNSGDAARQDVGYDDVAAAAASLRDGGKAVTVDAVRDVLGAGSPNAIYKHLAAWRASHLTPPAPPKAELPPAIMADLVDWVRQYADQAGAGTRDALAQSESDKEALLRAGEQAETERDGLQAQVADVTEERDGLQTQVAEATAERDRLQETLAERDETIQRLTAELANARQVAMDALVGKAKDQLAIEGKDAQLVDLRAQIERNVASTAALSDARLAAEMELVGAATARDSLAAEVKELRAQLEALRVKR